MAKVLPPIDDVEEVVMLLRAGDKLAHSDCGWRLVRGDAPVTDKVVAVLKRGDAALAGRLVPMGDQLPGMPARLAQTWRWARARKRVAA